MEAIEDTVESDLAQTVVDRMMSHGVAQIEPEKQVVIEVGDFCKAILPEDGGEFHQLARQLTFYRMARRSCR